MHKIILDGNEVQTLATESLPMLIHGKEGSGASMYTITLAAKWHLLSYKILFLCGYPMAEEAFIKEVGSKPTTVQFFTKEKTDRFSNALNEVDNRTIVFVKNIELFGNDVLTKVDQITNIIISGDISQSVLKAELLRKEFTTNVYFSPIEGIDLPALEKYTGFVTSGKYSGITSLLSDA